MFDWDYCYIVYIIIIKEAVRIYEIIEAFRYFGKGDFSVLLYITIAIILILVGIFHILTNDGDVRDMSLTFGLYLSLAIAVLVFPYYWPDDDLPIALIESFRSGLSGIALGVDGDLPYQFDMERPVFLLYRALLYSLYIIGPLVTSLFLFSLSSRVRTSLTYLLKKRYHIFSHVDENTLRIAESIAAKRNGDMLIFCNIPDAKDEFFSRIRQIGGSSVSFDIDEVPLRKKGKYEFYVSGDDDIEVIKNAQKLCEDLLKDENYRIENTVVRILASDRQKELLFDLDRQYSDKVYLRHIDKNASLSIEALGKCSDLLAVKKDLNVALISDNNIAVSFLKDLLCLMIKPDGKNTVTLIGPNASDLYDTLLREAPEADHYDIHVKEQAYGKECEAIEGMPDLIFVLYDDDKKNYDATMRIRRHLSSKGESLSCPKIMCHIANGELQKIIGEENGVELFGDISKSYTYDRLIDPPMEKAARKVHLFYIHGDKENGDEEKLLQDTGFYQYQNQRSSFAAAMGLRFKKRYILSFKKDEKMSDREFIDAWLADEKNMKKMMIAEHERWNAYQRMNGWRKADMKQTASIIKKYDGKRANDPELKLHPAMVEYNKLKAVEDKVNALMEECGSKKRVDYIQADKDIVEHLCDILDVK